MGQQGMRRILSVGLALGFMMASLTAGAPVGASVGQPAWDLPLLGGGRMSLAASRGSVVVASFGATWCPPCRAELPALQALAEKYAGKKVKVVWITIDDKKVSDQELAQFIQKLGVNIPVARDLTGDAFAQFKQSSIPFQVVIDRQGNLVGKPAPGFSDKETLLLKLSQVIDSLL